VDKVIHCDCGFDARAEDEDGLVAEVQRHASEAHGMALSDDEALLLALWGGTGRHGALAQTRSRSRPHPSHGVMSDREEKQ
jgi:hypothetical protein